MLNRSASLTMSTSVLKALPGKLDIIRHSPSILYLCVIFEKAKQFVNVVALYGLRLRQDSTVAHGCL